MNVYTRESYRRQGIAARMIEMLIREARVPNAPTGVLLPLEDVVDSLYLHTATSSDSSGRYRPTYQVMDGDWGKVADILLEKGVYPGIEGTK